MTVTSDMILTVDTIPEYLQKHWESLGPTLQQQSESSSSEDNNSITKNNTTKTTNYGCDYALRGIEVTAIEGGSVNFSFCIKFPVLNDKIVFLKQAPEFVAKFGPDGFPLTSERIQHEMDVYREWRIILGDTLSKKYLPNIYYFDKKQKVIVMEFLDGYESLDYVLNPTLNKRKKSSSASTSTTDGCSEHKIMNASCMGTFLGKVDQFAFDPPPTKKTTTSDSNSNSNSNNEQIIASSLGTFLGKVHAATHSSKISIERQMYLTSHFENREMRNVQLEFVFTKCYKEATAEQRSGLKFTKEFMFEIELLKRQYNGDGCVCGCGCGAGYTLIHGDLHPNSVLVDVATGSTKIIDPEFTVYGPAGVDIGFLLNGYCLGAIHHAYSNNPKSVTKTISCAETIWTSYKDALIEGGISITIINEIEIETVGFTVAEICRTVLGFAGGVGRSWLQFDDPKDTINSKNAALQLVEKCMMGRHNIYDDDNDNDNGGGDDNGDNTTGGGGDGGQNGGGGGGIELLFNELKKLTSSLSQPKSNSNDEWII